MYYLSQDSKDNYFRLAVWIMIVQRLDYERGNHFMVKNSWFMGVICISAGNFTYFFTTMFGPSNVGKQIRGSPCT
jgi:hypothetical protein